MKDKFNKIIYTIFISILVFIFIGIKNYNIYKFKVDNISIKKLNNISLKVINRKRNHKIENMNFYLDKSYTSSESELEFYQIKNLNKKDETNKSKIINISIYHNILRGICNESKLNPIEYLDLETDELILINNYIDNQDKKTNIFTSTKNIKMKYLEVLLLKAINISNEVSYLEGLNGLISNNKAILFNNHNAYIIDFDESYNEKEIINILSTVKFND